MRIIKKAAKSTIHAVAQLPVIKSVVYHRAVRNRAARLPGFRNLYGDGWNFKHPFDRRHQTDTSGFVPSDELENSPDDVGGLIIYGGSQPSIIRTALNALPTVAGATFVDLGCGKGRPLLVASEYPFRELVGVELSSALVERARVNAAIIGRTYPSRAPIRIEKCDAGQYEMPDGNVVIYLYHTFGENLVAQLVKRIEAAASAGRTLFVIYYNPVYGHCLDSSTVLRRFFAATVPYAAEELGYGPDVGDGVVIWQAGGQAPAHPNATSSIRITQPGSRAEVD